MGAKKRKKALAWELEDQLRELKEKLVAGTITQEEYEQKRRKLEELLLPETERYALLKRAIGPVVLLVVFLGIGVSLICLRGLGFPFLFFLLIFGGLVSIIGAVLQRIGIGFPWNLIGAALSWGVLWFYTMVIA